MPKTHLASHCIYYDVKYRAYDWLDYQLRIDYSPIIVILINIVELLIFVICIYYIIHIVVFYSFLLDSKVIV